MCSPPSDGDGGEEEEHHSVSPGSISRADLEADKINKCISIVMKPQEVLHLPFTQKQQISSPL